MLLKEILAKVSLAAPMELMEFQNTRFERTASLVPPDESRFFDAYEATIKELLVLYPGYVLDPKYSIEPTEGETEEILTENDLSYKMPKGLEEHNIAKPLFTPAIVDNIMFLLRIGQGDLYKTEFIRKSRSAYLKYWKDSVKGRIIKRLRW